LPESRKTINNGNTVAVFGSPRKNGFSSRLHEAYLSAAHGEVRRFYIENMDIHPCNGCLCCAESFRCVYQDSMNDFFDALRPASIVTFSFPLYFSAMPGSVKTMIDRFQPLWEESRIGKPSCRPGIDGRAFITAGSAYRNMFQPSITILRHLLHSIGGQFNRNDSIFCKNLDSAGGVEIFNRQIGLLNGRSEMN
jgi:multimeric flavodoxin WrbA